MRLVHTLKDQIKARKLSALLGAEGIENQLEIISNNDWGSESYGDNTCRLWVVNEDYTDRAGRLIEAFESNPNDPIYAHAIDKAAPILLYEQEGRFSSEAIEPDEILSKNDKVHRTKNERLGGRQKHVVKGASISTTFYIIMICSLLFLVDSMTEPTLKAKDVIKTLPIMPQMAAPLLKGALYDYPETYVLTDDIIAQFGREPLQTPQDLPKAGQQLYEKILNTPYWHGEYNTIKEAFKNDDTPTSVKEQAPSTGAPLFEKIREGEVWRLLTPALFHHDILHLLFNMLWVIVLGQQIEQRLGPRRYVLLAILIGVFSNTSQYLMGGPDFIGFSGIVCGMLTFILVRQKIAAWEGYPLEKSTINFLLLFIVVMMCVQVLSFFLETYNGISISPGLANTAHITGAIVGALLGRMPFFSWKS